METVQPITVRHEPAEWARADEKGDRGVKAAGAPVDVRGSAR